MVQTLSWLYFLASNFILTILSLLYDYPLSSLGGKKKLKTVKSTVSNLHDREKNIFERNWL